MKLAVATAAMYFLLDVIARTEAAVTEGVNAAIFPALCSELQLCDEEIEFVPSLYSEKPPLEDLYKLKMSLADSGWRASFVSKGDSQTLTAKPLPITGGNEEWKEKWSLWAEAAADLALDKAEEALHQKHSITNLKPERKQKLKQAVAELTEAAHSPQTQQTSELKRPADDTELKNQLLIALYRAPEMNKDQPENAKLFGSVTAGHATECSKAPPTGPDRSLAETIYCVCGTKDSDNVKPCNARQGTAVDRESSTAPLPSKWSRIRLICPKVNKKKSPHINSWHYWSR
uniref:Variant surface glycoprotein 1125.1548 n=1 Tax=Trypanosoma brucei TaxID=5691 RepID=A0A1J0R795_9TRYP|nr:variant surface glycoprotein 1125.1548 [Trypanosoma brucei]